jgi:hypothetical protein
MVLAVACTRRMYPGPRRPDSEISRLEANGVHITDVDGAAPKRGAYTIWIVPGVHRITFFLSDRIRGGRGGQGGILGARSRARPPI